MNNQIGDNYVISRRKIPIYNPSSDPDLFYWFDASDTSTLKGAGGAAIADGSQVYILGEVIP